MIMSTKQFITFCLLIIVTFRAESQLSKQWKSYYAYVDTAELCIVDSSYAKSLAYYQKAFGIIPVPYGKDYYNAALCANKSKKFDEAITFIQKLTEKGIDTSYFAHNKYLTELRATDQWKKYLASYSVYHKKSPGKQNSDLQKKYEKLRDKDQFYAKNKYTPGYLDSSFIGAYRVTLQFLELVNQYGFPDENLMELTKFPFQVVFGLIPTHYFQLKQQFNAPKFAEQRAACLKNNIDFNRLNLDSVLLKAVYEGKLHPHEYVGIFKTSSNNIFGNMLVIQVNDTLAELKFSPQKIKEFNTIRKEISLSSMEIYRKVALYDLYTLQKFRAKTKNETEKEYKNYMIDLLMNKDATNLNFILNTSCQFTMFYTNGDKDHKSFNKMYQFFTE
jgi:hypothetical protein